MKKPKNKKKAAPRPRHVWAINPKSRVKPSGKKYKRPAEKKIEKSWTDELGWFGD